MKDKMHTEGADGEKPKESRMRQTLTLAAAVAMLGVSVGANVQELLASGPGEIPQSDQSKFGGIQSKERAMQEKLPAIQDKRAITQPKLPAMQQKQPPMPGTKPVDPPR
jgi:hypothetical protein